MCEIIGSMILGAFAGQGARKIAWRPLLRTAIRQGLRAQHTLTEFGNTVAAEAKQLVAEAKNELDHSEPGTSSTV
jgi:CheY-specific phosphatase CheX